MKSRTIKHKALRPYSSLTLPCRSNIIIIFIIVVVVILVVILVIIIINRGPIVSCLLKHSFQTIRVSSQTYINWAKLAVKDSRSKNRMGTKGSLQWKSKLQRSVTSILLNPSDLWVVILNRTRLSLCMATWYIRLGRVLMNVFVVSVSASLGS